MTEDAWSKSSLVKQLLQEAKTLVDEVATRDDNKQKLVDIQAKHTLLLSEKKLFESQVKTKIEELKTEMTNMRY